MVYLKPPFGKFNVCFTDGKTQPRSFVHVYASFALPILDRPPLRLFAFWRNKRNKSWQNRQNNTHFWACGLLSTHSNDMTAPPTGQNGVLCASSMTLSTSIPQPKALNPPTSLPQKPRPAVRHGRLPRLLGPVPSVFGPRNGCKSHRSPIVCTLLPSIEPSPALHFG
jgi:hypothetical protein